MTPIRFIHTSDIHLDTSFSAAGFPSRIGHRKREAIRGTFRRILEDALREKVDLVLIAGDLYEHDHVTSDTIEFLKQQFENLASIPVLISPGNHDPALLTSPYLQEAWPANVRIFQTEAFQSVELAEAQVRVTGCAYCRPHMEEPLFEKLPVLPPFGWNLVLAHGSDLGGVPPGKAAHGPFTVGQLARKNVHYCALGHYHQQHALPNPYGGAQIWYCGIPEGRAWDEEGMCGYLLGEIGDQGELTITPRPSCQYPLVTITIDCDGFASREQIIDGILQRRGTVFDNRTILRVRLEGSPDPSLTLSTAEMEERLAGEALHIAWEDHTSPAIDFEAVARERTLCGYFARSMNQQISLASAADRPALERARLYGVLALLGREVRIR